MNKQEISDEVLMEYLDGNLAGDALAQLKTTMQKDDTVQIQLLELQILDKNLTDFSKLEPSIDFTQNVMSQIVPQAKLVEAHQPKQWMAIAFALANLLAVMIWGYYGNLSASMDYLTYWNFELNLSELGNWITKSVVTLVSIMSLALLDKVVLKPYFQGDKSSLV